MEDAYAYYVMICGISEAVFWNAECSELMTIIADKTAYDNWLTYAKQKIMKRN